VEICWCFFGPPSRIILSSHETQPPLPPLSSFCFLVVTARATDFKGQVTPVLKQYCYKCHSELQKKEKGKLVLDNMTRLAGKIGPSAIIKAGDPEGSTFYSP